MHMHTYVTLYMHTSGDKGGWRAGGRYVHMHTYVTLYMHTSGDKGGWRAGKLSKRSDECRQACRPGWFRGRGVGLGLGLVRLVRGGGLVLGLGLVRLV